MQNKSKGFIHKISKPRKFPDGSTRWITDDNCLHREDGPAIIYKNGDREWYYDNFLHRNDGPAIDNMSNGKKVWAIWGEFQPFDMDKFIYTYNPTMENIELLLCDKYPDVRKFAKQWYRENK